MSKKKKTYMILAISLIVMYLLLIFYYIHVKLVLEENPAMDIFTGLSEGFKDILIQPFAIFPLPSGIFMFILITLLIIGFVALVMWSTTVNRAHYKDSEAQGAAKWLEEKDLAEYDKKFTEPFGQPSHDGRGNMILSRDMWMSMDNRGIADHNNHNGRNMNVFAIGGSGAGKTFGLVGPNLLQANCSYIVTDPSGELFQNYGYFFEYMGYRVKCFNLDHMEKGNHYNPFNYIHSDKDIEVLVNTLITNTNPPEKTGGDPFWEKSETALLLALIAYLFHYCEPQYRNFSNVMQLLRAAEINENDDTAKSPLDYIFDQLEEEDPDSFAYKQYRTFKMGAGKTLKSILISCAVRLQSFDLVDVADLTDTDDIDLDSIGDEKTVLFIIIPTGDTTFNFLASLMYSQLFQRLYGFCENTAVFAQLVVDSQGDVIRTFRASSPETSEEAKRKAEIFLEKSRTAKVVEDRKTKLFYVQAQDNTILRYSNDKGQAEKFLKYLQNGKVVQNKRRMPIHVRMILDEFANTGKIPAFSEKVATIRKYEISTTIILQSLQQMKNLYEKEWEAISGNCDNTIYLGGGADNTTTEWMSKLLGKETRRIMSSNYNSGSQGGGSTGFQLQGVELYSMDQLRTMPEDECIVFQKSLHAYKGKKFPATLHKNWWLVAETPDYMFNAERANFLYKEYIKAGEIDEEKVKRKIPQPVPETKEEQDERKQINENEKKKAQEFAGNHDINREEIVKRPTEIKPEEDNMAKEVLKTENPVEVKEVAESLIESNELDIDDLEEIIFKSRQG